MSYVHEWVFAAALVGLVGLLFVPHLGWLIAFGMLLIAAVTALTGAVLAMPYLLVRSLSRRRLLRRRRRARSGAGQHLALNAYTSELKES
jgi:hypothetical protein